MSNWKRVGCAADFGDEGVFGAVADDVPVAIYRVGEDIFATHDICTHGQARLSEGFLEDCLIECPLHQGLFDIRTGEPVGPPCTAPVKTFSVRLEGEDIFVDISVPGDAAQITERSDGCF